MTLIIILALMAAAGIVITSLQLVVVWALVRIPLCQATRKPEDLPNENAPRVSILKPVSGLEDGLEENLASFVNLSDISYEMIISVAEADDPAIEVIERVRHRFPQSPFSLVVGGGTSGNVMNPKVERLMAAIGKARGEIIFISDSNVRVPSDFLARTIRAFDDPQVGCASNIFTAAGAKNFGATIESLYLLTFAAAGNALADAGEVPCVVGKSMAISRTALEKIGGLEGFSRHLAEDQAIGIAVTEAGYKLALSPVLVRNVIEKRSLRAAIDRQVRWAKIRYAFSKTTFTSEFLVNPFPFSLLACLVAIIAAPASLLALSIFSALTLLIRLLQAHGLARLTGAQNTLWQILLMPVQDCIQFGVTFIPYFSSEVNWRGHRARIGRGTVMFPSRRNQLSQHSGQKTINDELLITDRRVIP